MPSTTLIIGTSENKSRYSNLAAHRLKAHGIPIYCIGIRSGHVAGEPILVGLPGLTDVDTITLYLSPAHQQGYYDYIVGLRPRRVIFNPGTENDELRELLQDHRIETMEACTLVMLATGQY